MRIRSVVRAVGITAIAVALPALAAPAANAAPGVAPAVLSAMQRDLGLTADAAQARVESDLAAAKADEGLRSTLGAAYSGSWIDASTGTLTVRTTAAAAAPAITAAGASPVVVAPDKDPKAGKAKLDEATAPRSVASWFVDEAAGTVVVETTNPAEANAFVAQSAATEPVQVRQVAQAPRLFADLIGGQAIYASNGGRCSIGFSATSGAGAVVITAGHCTEIGGTWSGVDQQAIGPVAASAFPGDDFGTITVNSTATWNPTGQVEGSTSVTGSTEATVGASTCRSGSTTGFRCGTVQAKNSTVNYGGGDVVYGLTQTNACAEPGDSGGSFVSGSQAQGMTSGGSGDCTFGGTTFFQPVNEALSRLGLTLVTG